MQVQAGERMEELTAWPLCRVHILLQQYHKFAMMMNHAMLLREITIYLLNAQHCSLHRWIHADFQGWILEHNGKTA